MKNSLKLAASSAIALAAASPAPRAVIGHVRTDASDPKAMFAELNTAFAAFKEKNDESLGAKVDDIVLTEHVDRINAAISDIQAKMEDQANKIAATKIGAGAGSELADAEYSQAFASHFTKGAVEANLNKGADDQGGYLAPVEWDRTITDKLVIVSPMRSLCRLQTIGTAGYSKLFNKKGTDAGWVGEDDARPETGTATFGSLTYKAGELYANPAATQQMLDDSEVDLEAWLATEVEEKFAQMEGQAFISGNGTDKPTGLLNYVTGGANAATHPLGAISTINSGAAADITSDGIIDLIYDLPAAYQQNASFIMNRRTVQKVRKRKDGQGNYLWQPTYAAGEPATLAGYRLTEIEDMPDVAANAVPIMFGDFQRGYIIIDRTGTRVMRDPYTSKPYVLFYTTKRVGGGLLNPQVFRAMKVAA